MALTSDEPATVRQLNTREAQDLAGLASIFDDLQTVLRCCERLLAEFAAEPDEIVVEAVWTTAVLSYARCFAGDDGVRLTEQDLTATSLQGDVLAWHRVLGQLREHYTDATANPRERFAVGATLDSDGAPVGIAVTSAPQPRLDDVTVRQTGALAYELSKVVDERIAARQAQVFAMSAADLGKLPLIDVTVSF